AALTAIFVNLILGAVLLLALPAAARRITRHEPQIFRLWRLSWSQRAHYDPGKVRR
ncbi:MAG: VirB3 family type IV secretion system protein, partial [Acetobacteraceae bacterium]|nr:VirB3 family type IV secretion system protein [Acetobacteraceae bacterium]